MSKPAAGELVNTGSSFYTNMSAYFYFRENTGLTIADASGLGHQLTFEATAGVLTWGTDSSSDVCIVTLDDSGRKSTMTSPITVGAAGAIWSVGWRGFLANASSVNGIVCGAYADTNNFILMRSDTNQVEFRSNNGTTTIWSVTDPTVQADYELSYDGTKLHLFQNNAEIGTGQAQPADTFVIDSVCCGYSSDGGTTQSLSYAGDLSYLGIWAGRVLTGAEISTLHTAATTYSLLSPPSAAASPLNIPQHHGTNITLTLTGRGTSWVHGTTIFTLSGVAGVTLVSQNVTSATAATIVVTTDNNPAHIGTLTVTETVTGSTTAAVNIGLPTISISPSSGASGGSTNVTLTGVNTVWTQESGSFITLAGTASFSSGPTVTSDTTATATIADGSSAGAQTITDNPTGATTTFSVTSGSITVGAADLNVFSDMATKPARYVVPVVTAADGTATAYTPENVWGRVLSITYVKDGLIPFTNGVALTVTAEATGAAILTKTAMNAQGHYYPRSPASDGAPPVLANDRVKLAITGGGNGNQGVFHIVVG